MKESDVKRKAAGSASSSTKAQQQRRIIRVRPADTSYRQVTQHDVSVTIDIAGRITDCTPEAKILLGHRTHQLSGMALTDVIPKLPFCPNTPYYNLAFAVFSAGSSRPIQRMATAADGKKIPIDIALSRTIIRGRHLIKVHLSPSKMQTTSTNKEGCNYR